MDYGYGFDYEKAIRDRLKAANDAFANDSTSSIRKQTRVSFDNSVTAFDTKIEEMSTVHSVNITSDTNIDDLEKNNSEVDTKKSLEKIPLNDTVKKENPDEFQNKIKEAVAKYDAENSVKKPHVVEDKEDDESEILIKHKPAPTKKVSLDDILNNNEQPLPKNGKQNGVKFKKTSFEDSDNDEIINEVINDNVNNNNINNNNNHSNNINSNNNNNNNISPKKPQKTVKIIDESEDLNKTTHPVESISFEDPIPAKHETFSFNAPQVIEDDIINNNTDDNKKLIRRSSNSSTDSAKHVKEDKVIQKNESDKQEGVSEIDGGEKVLIEKDGKFLYVDSDEYTAKERERIALLAAEEKKKNNDKIAEKPPLLPHPPTRPKTSNGRNIHRVTTQESQFKNNSSSELSSNYSGSFVRNAHSADSRSRQQ